MRPSEGSLQFQRPLDIIIQRTPLSPACVGVIGCYGGRTDGGSAEGGEHELGAVRVEVGDGEGHVAATARTRKGEEGRKVGWATAARFAWNGRCALVT